ncbi:MAG: thioredoxin family protein [Ignavibacteria bacterium]|nr:thioredoxin family protein [Ignavibacteria bacterium]
MKELVMKLKFLGDKFPNNGMSYEEYKKLFANEIENPPAMYEKNNYDIKKLNLSRSTRVEKQFVPSDELIEAVNKINTPQLWMVLTETWCGDSAQNLPVLVKIAELNKNVDFQILLRDSNPEIMDQYLTNGTRSIPKLIAFNEDGKELFRWGARPAAAQQLVNELKKRGLQKNEWLIELHKWYANNRGKEIEQELLEFVNNL